MAEKEYEAADHQRQKPPLVFEIWLGFLETLINGFIDIDPDTRAQIRAHAGLVLRIKTSDPYMVFYMMLTPEGVELYSHNPGPAKIRIGGTLFALSTALLGGQGIRNPEKVRIWGDPDNVYWLMELLRQYNVRTAAQRWLRENMNLKELLQKVNRHDPSWLTDLMPMPGMMREAMSEIRKLRSAQQDMDALLVRELASQKAHRQGDLVSFALTLLVLMVTVLPGASWQQRLQGMTMDQILGSLFIVLLLAWRFVRADRKR